MTFNRHRIWQLAADAALIAAAWWLAFQLRFDFEVPIFFRRMPNLRLDDSRAVQWHRDAGNRGPIALPVVF